VKLGKAGIRGKWKERRPVDARSNQRYTENASDGFGSAYAQSMRRALQSGQAFLKLVAGK
jgi:hypothetical protein